MSRPSSTTRIHKDGRGILLEEEHTEEVDLLSDDISTSSSSSSSSSSRQMQIMSRSPAKRETPLPMLQLTILFAIRLAEPIAYTQIFPYINQMMVDLKVTDQPSQVGYYSGIVDSIFAVTQLFTIFHWGRLSDRIGRKPVILLGLLGVSFSTLLFGYSKSFAWAIFSRSLAGALSGNAAVVESVIGEITDETNQAKAFPMKGVSWCLGAILGPVIGGGLATPAKQWPNGIGKIEVLREYPYLLPCIVSALITVCSIIFGLIFMKESLPSKVAANNHRLKLDNEKDTFPLRLRSPSPPTAPAPPSPQTPTINIRHVASHPIMKNMLHSYFILSVLNAAFDVLFVLMAYTPLNMGGLSRTPEDIGYVLAFSGLAGAIVQQLAFPHLQRRWSYVPMYRTLMLLWPLLFALMPFLNSIAKWDMMKAESGGGVSGGEGDMKMGWILYSAILGVLALHRTACMCYAVSTILIKNASPSQEALGASFGLSQSVACLARALAPAFASTIFALSKKHPAFFSGNFVWLIMVLIGVSGVWSSWKVVDGGEGHNASSSSTSGWQVSMTMMREKDEEYRVRVQL